MNKKEKLRMVHVLFNKLPKDSNGKYIDYMRHEDGGTRAWKIAKSYNTKNIEPSKEELLYLNEVCRKLFDIVVGNGYLKSDLSKLLQMTVTDGWIENCKLLVTHYCTKPKRKNNDNI